MLLAVACANEAPNPTATGSGVTTPTAGQASEMPSPSPSQTTSGGGGSAAACDLLTAAEVEAATGQPSVTAEPYSSADSPGESHCNYLSDGILPVASTGILGPNTNTDPSGYLSLPGSVELSVSGARAIFAPASGYITFIFKGSTVASLQVSMPAEGDDFQAAAEKLVQKVADRI
jgi:hypothetical protein